MRWFRRRRESPRPPVNEPDQIVEVGSDRAVFWKAKEQIDGVDYGPVWIADANDPIFDEPEAWLSWEEAEEFARERGLPLEDV